MKQDGYDIQTYVQVPFNLAPKGIILEVDTNLGKMKLILDTGCTWTMLHDFLCPKNIKEKVSRYNFLIHDSDHFIMNENDFGSQEVFFLKMTEQLKEVDGFLGMDFIKRHVMYIDFSKKVLYIQK